MSTGTVPISESDIKNFEIEFKNVSFKYPGSEDYVLKNVSLKLNSGSCTAIVGQNGSGKTTFIKLLCRLYDPTEGVITLNGRDIREYDYAQYMRVFSVVFQDFKLFDFMLAQNVASGSGYDGGLVEECLENPASASGLSRFRRESRPICTRDFLRRVLTFPAAKRRRSPLREPFTATLRS